MHRSFTFCSPINTPTAGHFNRPERLLRITLLSIQTRSMPRKSLARCKDSERCFRPFIIFPRKEARAILQNAIDAGQSIAIFEITRRAPLTISLMFAWALMPFVFTLFIRPFRWSRLFCTYVVPIIPLVLLFDGVVSCLRTYRPRELREIVDKLSGIEYQWEVGEHSKASGRAPITYLIGSPQTRGSPT